jgi:hypothetical protein
MAARVGFTESRICLPQHDAIGTSTAITARTYLSLMVSCSATGMTLVVGAIAMIIGAGMRMAGIVATIMMATMAVIAAGATTGMAITVAVVMATTTIVMAEMVAIATTEIMEAITLMITVATMPTVKTATAIITTSTDRNVVR